MYIKSDYNSFLFFIYKLSFIKTKTFLIKFNKILVKSPELYQSLFFNLTSTSIFLLFI